MNRRKKKPAQVISIILSFVMFGMMGLSQLVGSLGNNNTPALPPTLQANPTPFPTLTTSIFEANLSLNQSTDYELQAGEIIALHYQGRAEQVISLRVTSEDDIAPQITIGASVEGQAKSVLEVVPSIGATTEICGLILPDQADYTFTFEAPVSSTYHVQLESGTTCDAE